MNLSHDDETISYKTSWKTRQEKKKKMHIFVIKRPLLQHKRNGSEERKGKWGIEWKQSKGDTEYEKSRGQLDINSYFLPKIVIWRVI